MNIAAAAVALPAADLARIDAAAAAITVRGDRYPEALERMTGRGALGAATRLRAFTDR